MDLDAAIDTITIIALDHRATTDADRRLAQPVVDAVVEHRLCRLPLPEQKGGWGLGLVEFLQVLERLAGAEASLPWLLWNNAQVCLSGRFFPVATSDALFSDPAALFAISAIPVGEAVATADGYQVTGRWPLVSGCELADWLVLSCRVSDPDGRGAPVSDYVVVHRSDVEIIDTWHTGGMRGTGS
ncbi:MAG: acyl-CoA dehydrogenase family protein, partial [Acidimicrobiia bacterium]